VNICGQRQWSGGCQRHGAGAVGGSRVLGSHQDVPWHCDLGRWGSCARLCALIFPYVVLPYVIHWFNEFGEPVSYDTPLRSLYHTICYIVTSQCGPPAQPTAQSDPDLEVKDYGYGFGAASGSEYINALAEEMMRRQRVWNAERPERAREREAEWRLQQQQHMGRGFGGGGERGFGPSERGGYGKPRGAPMPPLFAVMPHHCRIPKR
jgi:hypothetical protein